MFLAQPELTGSDDLRYGHEPCQWALVQFQQSVFCPLGSLLIGSKLDIDTTQDGTSTGGGSSGGSNAGGEASESARQCRLAFYGPIRQVVSDEDIAKLRIYNWRSKEGSVFKLTDVRAGLCYELIGQDMVTNVSGVQAFQGMRVQVESLREGVITGPFGSDGKFKVKFEVGTRVKVGSKLTLRYKRFVYDRSKSMHQSAVSELDHLPAEEPDSGPEPDKSASRNNKNKKQAQQVGQQQQQVNNSSSTIAEQGKVTTTSAAATSSSSSVVSPVIGSTVVAQSVMALPSVIRPVMASSVNQPVGNIREGIIDSLKQETTTAAVDGVSIQIIAIVRDAFRMEENIRTYIGSKVECNTSSAQILYAGELVGPYAKMGKCKVRFPAHFQGMAGDVVTIVLVESNL